MSTVIEVSSDSEHWGTCVCDPDYEICDQYPYNIRKKGCERCLKLGIHKGTGYLQCNMNGKHHYHHRLVAEQFIPNDDPVHNIVIDHINHNRTDNHIENLRWCTPAQNSQNLSGSRNNITYTYVDDIDDDAFEITSYGNRTLKGYFYDENLDQFYVKIDALDRYRLLHVIHTKAGAVYVNAKDVEGNRFNLMMNKFKKDYGLD